MANTRGIRAGRAFVELGVNDRLSAGLRRAQARIGAFASGVQRAGIGLTAIGAAAAVPLAGAVKLFASAGDQLDKLSARTGISVESLSQLKFAAEQSGSSIEGLGQAVLRANRRIGRIVSGTGSGSQVEALEALGLTAENLADLNPEQRLLAIADAMSAIEDPTVAAGLAQRAFGSSVDDILPLLLQGADGINALKQEADSLGLTMSTETATQAAALSDAFNRLRSIVRVVIIEVGASLAPAIERTSEALKAVLSQTIAWTRENGGLIVAVASVAAGTITLGVALLGAAVAIKVVALAFGVAAAVVTGLGAAVTFLLSPLGLLVGALAASTAAFLSFTDAGGNALDAFGTKFRGLLGIARETLNGIKDALAVGDFKLAAEILFSGLKVAWLEGTNGLLTAWEDFKTDTAAVFIQLGADVQRIWARTIAAVQSLTAKAFSSISTTLARIAETLGLIDEQRAGILSAVARGFGAGVAGGADEALTNRLEQISDEQAAALEALLEGASEREREQIQKLIDARRDLEQAIEEARQRRDLAAGPGGGAGADGGGIGGAAAGAAAAARSATVRGSFNVFRSGAVTRPLEDAARRTAEATEKTASNTKRLVEASRNGTLVFT